MVSAHSLAGKQEAVLPEIHEVKRGMTIHRTDGGSIFASQGYEIFKSFDAGESWRFDGSIALPWWRNAADSAPLLRQLRRAGISTILPLKDGTRLCTLPKMIAHAEPESKEYKGVLGVSNGSRPLSLCEGEDGSIYWGEYFLNLRRSKPIHIFCSKDAGRTWKIAYTFERGSICHVHRIVYDAYEGNYLICTGDRDQEVSILKTANGFHRMEALVEGNQLYRTTSLVPLGSCILYGTDNPGGENYVMALDRKSGETDKIQKLPGPVLYGCQVGELTVFATMVEKQHHEASLWAGDENGFSLLAHFKARKWVRPFRELVGYPTIILPEGKGEWPYLFCTPIGTERYADSLLRIDLSKAVHGKAHRAERIAEMSNVKGQMSKGEKAWSIEQRAESEEHSETVQLPNNPITRFLC